MDWYESSKWCIFYDKACTEPLEKKDGASSYKLIEQSATPKAGTFSFHYYARVCFPARTLSRHRNSKFYSSVCIMSNRYGTFRPTSHLFNVAPSNAKTTKKWETIDPSHACEINDENIRNMVDLPVDSLERCKTLCMAAKHCEAIDWFSRSKWCTLYKKPCTKPLQAKHGGSSYRLVNKQDPLETGTCTFAF